MHTAVEQLVWAHKRGPAEMRAIAMEFILASDALLGCVRRAFGATLSIRCTEGKRDR